MEVFNTILTAVSTVGFPIVFCILLFNNNVKVNETLANNTKAIESLTIYIKEKG